MPVVGEDESFPGGFTIRAEKCPNRRGVEAHRVAIGRRIADRSTSLCEQIESEGLRRVLGDGGLQDGLE